MRFQLGWWDFGRVRRGYIRALVGFGQGSGGSWFPMGSLLCSGGVPVGFWWSVFQLCSSGAAGFHLASVEFQWLRWSSYGKVR